MFMFIFIEFQKETRSINNHKGSEKGSRHLRGGRSVSCHSRGAQGGAGERTRQRPQVTDARPCCHHVRLTVPTPAGHTGFVLTSAVSNVNSTREPVHSLLNI